MELECSGSGTGFLALISDGVSRAIRGEKIYTNIDVLLRNASTTPTINRNTWAVRVAEENNLSLKNSVWEPSAKPSNPPKGQSHEDKRIMIRLGHDYEAIKADPFLLRQQIQSLIPDPFLVSDAWQAPSGIAILVPTPAKVATLLQ
ncbi:putative effector protein [Erysiphe necator]|uniref:Putative effector protein n=1 Tax=Uncinula necator TaxID=52586 RepID=A0A0B1PAJ5_UNCNE|nr:putative effector protein [Erysiphe necator]